MELHLERAPLYGWHDMSTGYLFADWYKDRARYVLERKKWFVYDGKAWWADVGGLMVMRLCKELVDALVLYALTLPNEQLKQNYLKYASRWQRLYYRETVLRDAMSVYPAALSDFDKDPFLFNCQNGTLDLRAGKFRLHD